MSLIPKKVLIAIYQHPEAFPPTLNAINTLAQRYQSVEVVSNRFLKNEFPYPSNVSLKMVGPPIPNWDYAHLPAWKKLYRWLRFSLLMLSRAAKADVLIIYDAYPIPSYYYGRWFLFKKPKTIWYHNHDVIEAGKENFFSLNYLASSTEPKLFPLIDIFSLPAEERKTHFPLEHLKGSYFFLPNFPSTQIYQIPEEKNSPDKEIKVIYQGTMSEGRGIEEIIQLLDETIAGHDLKLVLKGFIRNEYQEKLQNLIHDQGVANKVTFEGVTPYQDVPKIAMQCHIGLAVFTKNDIMNRTLGTASNKIYEYAACGLPVLYFDHENFRKHLDKYSWAIPTDLSKGSLLSAIEYIIDHYETLSSAARITFLKETNFEGHFKKVLDYLNPHEQ